MKRKTSRKIKGIGASGGIAIGPIYLAGREEFSVFKRRLSQEEIPHEILRFEEALISTRKSLVSLQEEVSKKLSYEHARIFDAHLLVLEDRALIEDVITKIKKEKVNAEYAFSEVIKKYAAALASLRDDYLKERAIDINDVAKRVLSRLVGKEEEQPLLSLKEKAIIVAHDLSPADTAVLPKQNVLGFVTDIGGRTSHTAIIASSLGIPAVVGLRNITEIIDEEDILIIDGSEGTVIVNPSPRVIEEYKLKRTQQARLKKIFSLLRREPAKTLDDKRVTIAANVEFPEEIPLVSEWGCEGIGLYRTEYMFLGRKDFPQEEEQFQAYFDVAREVKPDTVIIRTLDIGGDKFLSQPDMPKEIHPFLGWRAIRFCLARPDIFKTQLRAILRASVLKNVKIMFPMISGVEELKQAKAMLEETKSELRKKKIGFDENIQVGAMIEVPSAALTSDFLAREADFFSIGTNDLIQYSLAVDRSNEKVAYLYEPGHPAVISLIKSVIDSGHRHGIKVGMCGEMASEPLYAFILLGLELDEFSIPPAWAPKLKRLIRAVKFSDAITLAEKIMRVSTAKEVEKLTRNFLKEILGNKYKSYLSE